MSEARGAVSPPIAVAFALVGFVALVIAGFGMVSLLTDTEVIAVSGLGSIPGVVAFVAAAVVFAGAVWTAVRPRSAGGGVPGYGSAPITAIATSLGYLLGLGVGGVGAGVDPARALAAVGGFALSWFALVLAGAALACGWGAVALVRTRAERPRWPWEDDAD